MVVSTRVDQNTASSEAAKWRPAASVSNLVDDDHAGAGADVEEVLDNQVEVVGVGIDRAHHVHDALVTYVLRVLINFVPAMLEYVAFETL